MAHNRDILIRTARALGPLCERFVFTGGSIVELLITDEAGPPVRSTDDVDVIVEAATTADYHDLYPDLAHCGFSPDPQSGVICRFKKGDLLLDVMPSQADILGFTNIWYTSALRYPMSVVFVRRDLVGLGGLGCTRSPSKPLMSLTESGLTKIRQSVIDENVAMSHATRRYLAA